MSLAPAFGVTTVPLAWTAVGCFAGFLNQAFWPRYQIAVQSPSWPATAYCWPVETREARSFTSIVESPPPGRRPMSLISGALSSGALYSRTSLEPCAAQGSSPSAQPVYRGVLAA